jgi:hypothetical protein
MEAAVTDMADKQQNDPAAKKGAVEGDRPDDQQMGNRNGNGIDDQGMPNDPIATAEDAIGARNDESEGG